MTPTCRAAPSAGKASRGRYCLGRVRFPAVSNTSEPGWILQAEGESLVGTANYPRELRQRADRLWTTPSALLFRSTTSHARPLGNAAGLRAPTRSRDVPGPFKPLRDSKRCSGGQGSLESHQRRSARQMVMRVWEETSTGWQHRTGASSPPLEAAPLGDSRFRSRRPRPCRSSVPHRPCRPAIASPPARSSIPVRGSRTPRRSR